MAQRLLNHSDQAGVDHGGGTARLTDDEVPARAQPGSSPAVTHADSSRVQDGTEVANRLPGRTDRIRSRQNFRRKKSSESDLPQHADKRREVQMSPPRGVAVAVCDMDMAQARPGAAEAAFH